MAKVKTEQVANEPDQRVDDILKRLAEMKRIREPWLPVWQDVTDYVLPRRSFWDQDGTEGRRPSIKIYDSYPLEALQQMADGLQGYLVAPSFKWLKFKMENETLNDQPGVADWLETVEIKIEAEFQRTRFYQAVSEFFLDGGSVGTAVMLVDDDVGHSRTLFSTRHLKECYISEDRSGNVDTLYREFTITNRQALQQFGKKLSASRQQKAKEQPFSRMKVVHAVFPRDDREYNKIDSLSKPYASIYIDADERKQIDEGGYDTFPYCVWRYRKNSDETYGRSPAIDAINDVLRLHQIAKTGLEAAQLAVTPPLNVPSSMKGYERIVPRGLNYFSDPNAIITPINLAQNYSIEKDQLEMIRKNVADHFRTAFFLLMEQATRQMTAREVIERQGEKAAVLGVIMGGLNSDFFIPVIERVYAILERRGEIPPAPAGLSGRIKIEFMGPLAQAQRRYHQTQGIQAGLQSLLPIAQLNPETLDIADLDEAMRIGLDTAGMPQKVIRERPDVEKLRAQRAQAAAQQQQAAAIQNQQAMVAQNANKLNEPVQADSLLDRLSKYQQGQQVGAPPEGGA